MELYHKGTLRKEWSLQIKLAARSSKRTLPMQFYYCHPFVLMSFYSTPPLNRLPLSKEPTPLPKDTGLISIGPHICPCLCFWMLQDLGCKEPWCALPGGGWKCPGHRAGGPRASLGQLQPQASQLLPAPVLRTQKLEEFLGHSLSADLQHTTEQNLLVWSFNSLHPRR